MKAVGTGAILFLSLLFGRPGEAFAQPALSVRGAGGAEYGVVLVEAPPGVRLQIAGRPYANQTGRLLLRSARLPKCFIVSVPAAEGGFDQYIAGVPEWEGVQTPEIGLTRGTPEIITVMVLSAEQLAQAELEQTVKAQAWQARPETRVGGEPWLMPVDGTVSSTFAKRRITNGVPKVHLGVDFRFDRGDAIRAPSSGVVTLAQDLVREGGTVFVYHGNGLTTAYLHLKEIKVAVGQAVAPGDTLGIGGGTGQVTGPHLHWTAKLDGHPVDPLDFAQQTKAESNALFVRRTAAGEPALDASDWIVVPSQPRRARCV